MQKSSNKEPTVRMPKTVANGAQPAMLPPGQGDLSSLRRRQRRRTQGEGGRHWLRWLLIGMVVLLVVGVIATPLVYRSLRPELRDRISRHLPFMKIFDPQRAYEADVLPTLDPDSYNASEADDLLNSLSGDGADTDSEAVPPVNDEPAAPAESGDTGQGAEAESALPQGQDQDPAAVAAVTSGQDEEAPAAAALPSPTATTSPLPTNTPPPPPTATPLPTAVAQAQVPPSARLYSFRHVPQHWNNCGPATLTMGLSYYGWQEDQSVAANYLKPDSEDKNVSPGQMVRFVNERTGVRAITRIGGDLTMLRRLIFEGFPVIVEAGFAPEGEDWMGHYRLVVAYDDTAGDQRQGLFWVYDSYLGVGDGNGLTVDYSLFDSRWRHFNRAYIVIYDQAREGELREILGDDADLTLNARHALEVAQREAQASPEDPFAWFNVGSSYMALGMADEAARAYDRARNAGPGLPWRMLWYQFGPFEAYFDVGRYDDVLALVQANLNTTPYVEETYYWTGRVYEAQGQQNAALAQYNLALQHNSNYTAAQEAINRLNGVAQSGS